MLLHFFIKKLEFWRLKQEIIDIFNSKNSRPRNRKEEKALRLKIYKYTETGIKVISIRSRKVIGKQNTQVQRIIHLFLVS